MSKKLKSCPFCFLVNWWATRKYRAKIRKLRKIYSKVCDVFCLLDNIEKIHRSGVHELLGYCEGLIKDEKI